MGLRQPDLPGWWRVRDAQHLEAARQIPLIYIVNLAALLLTTATLWRPGHNAPLLGWASCDACAMLALIRVTRTSPGSHGPFVPEANFHSLLRGTLIGLMWAIPPALFAGFGSEVQRLTMCLICVGMMAFTAITAMTLPVGMMSALFWSSFGVSAMMIEAGGRLPLILLPQLYAGSLAFGGVAGARAFLRRHWSEHEVAENREVVSLLLREFDEADMDWLWETDPAKALVRVSPRLADAAGRDADEIEGQSLPRVLAGMEWPAGPTSPEIARLLALLNGRESFSDLELPVVIRGETRWWCLSAAPRFGPEGNYLGFRGKGSDVTEKRRSHDLIDRAAKFDALTGLANRTHFMDQLRRALTRSQRAGSAGGCALLLIDLDRFKPVNDTLGHPAGDRLLKLVAERLRHLLADHEFAGRLGGDEFAILLRSLPDPARVELLCEAVIARITEPFEIEGHLIRIGASLGSALGPRDGSSVETLVRHADLALYRAKADGRGCHRRYAPALLAESNRRRAIETGLRRALDTGALQLVYQPIADMRGGSIRSFEALLRWTDPTLGEVPPAQFIPIAEEARLSGRVGEWVLRTACGDAAGWPDDVRVAVNLSAEQLGDRQLAATVMSALSHAGLAPARLVLEISEAVFLRGGADVLAVMDTLRALGVGFALDDFGTGHAALAYISSGGIDMIKIDHALVRGVADSRIAAIALVRAVVALADSLGISTVAEGTETQAEQDAMAALGCGHVQGHLIGRPLPERTVRALIRATADAQAGATAMRAAR